MNNRVRPVCAGRFVLLAVMLAGVAVIAAAPATRTFSGVITDDNCVKGDHSLMKMGDTDAECAVACVNAHGSSYVLFDGQSASVLSDQKTPEKFAGKKVLVVGSLDEKARTRTILVTSITESK